MAEDGKLLKEAKQIIRSLLISTPTGLTIRQLCIDYKMMNGKEIPHRELGYNNVKEFIQNISDVAKLEWLHSINDFVLKAIADDTTEHIQKLVQKQKKTTSGYPKLNRVRGHPPFRRIRNRPTTKNLRSDTSDSVMARTLRSHIITMVPAKVRSQVRQLLFCYEDGLLISNFNIAFKKHFGSSLPYITYGFHTLEDCLNCIPDVCFKRSDDTNLVRVFLSSSKQKIPSLLDHTYRNTVDTSFSSRCGEDRNDKHLSTNCLNKFSVNTTEKKLSTEKLSEQGRLTREGRLPESRMDDLDEFEETGDKFLNVSKIQNGVDIAVDDNIPETMKIDFHRVLSYYPNGIWAMEFLKQYSVVTRKTLNLNELGFHSFMELVSELPDVFFIYRPDSCKDDWLLYDAKNPICESIEKSPKKVPTSDISSIHPPVKPSMNINQSPIDDSIKYNVLSLLQNCSKELSLEDFEKFYKVAYDAELPWISLGYNDIESFIMVLSDDIPLKLTNTVGGRVYVSLLNEQTDFQLDSSSIQCHKDTSENIPPDAVLPGTSYMVQPLPQDITKYIGVFVSNIDNPDQIWIQVRGETTTEALEILMEKLEETYDVETDNKYKLPDTYVAVDNICVAVWPGDNNWHRGIITGIPGKNSIEILYVDYGSKCTVTKASLRFLKKEFLTLPAQAIKGRLANIKPINERQWCDKSKHKLLEMCCDKPLVALITNTTYKDRISVCLCDVTGSEDKHINDILVKEGLAVQCNDPLHETPPNQTVNIHSTSPLPVQVETDAVNAFLTNIQTCLNNSNIDVNALHHLLSSCSLLERESRVVYSEANELHEERSSILEIFEEDEQFFNQLNEATEDSEFFVKRFCSEEGYKFHIITFNRKRFVTSEDISSMFWRTEGVEKLLKMKKIYIPCITLQQSDSKELFDDLIRCNVRGIKDASSVILYPLESIPEILTRLGHPSKILKKEIIKELQLANRCLNKIAKAGHGSEDIEMQINELKGTICCEISKREEILKEMLNDNDAKDYVEEVQLIENRLQSFKTMLKELEREKELKMTAKENASSASPKSMQINRDKTISIELSSSTSMKSALISNKKLDQASSSATIETGSSVSSENPCGDFELDNYNNKFITQEHFIKPSESVSNEIAKNFNPVVIPSIENRFGTNIHRTESSASVLNTGTIPKTSPYSLNPLISQATKMPSKPCIRFQSHHCSQPNIYCPTRNPFFPAHILQPRFPSPRENGN